jgi:hypothetical protein
MSALDMNCKSKTLKDKNYIKSPFWQAVLRSHLDSKPLLEKDYINENNFRMQLLWNNINVQYKGNVLFFPAWKNAGIERFNDIINVDEKRLLNINEVVNKIRKNHANIVFQYNAITNAIPSSWKQWVSVVGHSEMQQQHLFDLRKYCAKPKIIMKMLWQIDRNSEHVKSCAQGFWLRKLNVEIDKSIWLIPHLATKETRLRELQWKIIHNLYPTNILLHKMKITSDDKCSLCRDEIDYLETTLFHCPPVKQFWLEVELFLRVTTGIWTSLQVCDVLFGFSYANQEHIKSCDLNRKNEY